jgi:hypothetical protein
MKRCKKEPSFEPKNLVGRGKGLPKKTVPVFKGPLPKPNLNQQAKQKPRVVPPLPGKKG